MKLTKSFLAANLVFSLVFIAFLTLAISTVSAQDTKIALQRGYRTGYSDGYMAGYRDTIENTAKSYARHNEYRTADRAFSEDYGKLTDYKDGYQQGFELGYDSGFDKQSFDATIPQTLRQRGFQDVKTPVETAKTTVQTTVKTTVNTTPESNSTGTNPGQNSVAVTQPVQNPTANNTPTSTTNTVDDYSNTDDTIDYTAVPDADNVSDSTNSYIKPKPIANNTVPNISSRTEPQRSSPSGSDIIVIPTATELIIELLDEIDTKRMREGDAFKARVISPNEINGAIIEGRIAKNRQPGRLKRRAELLLSFDRIILSNNRWSNFNAIIVEVLPVKGDNVKRVDQEGTVEGTRPYKKDGITVGAATGSGLIIGAIAGGPVGAAVGAGVGAAFGVGAVVVERGEYIQLRDQQQMRIKTAYETQIR